MEEIPKYNPKRGPSFIPAPNFSKENQPEGRGRPKGSISIINHVKKMLENGAEREACAKSLLKNLKKGNPAVVREILGRVDGPLAEKHEHELTDNLMAAVVAALAGLKASE